MSDPYIEPTERTFYAPIFKLLDDLNFKGSQEIKVERGKYVDIIFQYDGIKFILEVKLGVDPRDLIRGIVQCYEYSRKDSYKTDNIIIINYPSDVKNAKNIKNINEVAVHRSCECVILTDFWYEYNRQLDPHSLFNQLRFKLENQLSSTSNIDSASRLLKVSIRNLSKAISRHYRKDKAIELYNSLTKDFALFKSLTYGRKNYESQLVNLLAYILVNQLLFYYLYSMERPDEIEALKEIENLDDLEDYFAQIRNIDFRPIFDIDVELISKLFKPLLTTSA